MGITLEKKERSSRENKQGRIFATKSFVPICKENANWDPECKFLSLYPIQCEHGHIYMYSQANICV